MKFKFKHTRLNFSNAVEINDGFNVVFSFSKNIERTFKKLAGQTGALLADNLDGAGATILVGNNILVSLGAEDKFTIATWLNVAASLAKFSSARTIKQVNLQLDDKLTKNLNIDYELLVERFLVEFVNALYYFDDFKTEKQKLLLENIVVVTTYDLKQVFANVVAILEGYFTVRDLANNPANIATPSYLAKTAQGFAKISDKVTATILNRKEIEKLGMHSFLAVAQGSVEEPKFIKLEYKGAKKTDKPVVLVGKGITFDSGGISIKPSANMDSMKYDMCGAATVLGVFSAVARLGLTVNLTVLVATCENMPSGNALKPGDIIKSMSGKTIEVLNTDAEGRLILCDALHYAKDLKPEWVIDVATLTGACIVALGAVASGLYVNDEDLHSLIQTSSVAVNDKVWRMPLFDEYRAVLKGNHADLQNIGGWVPKAGSVTAACFLQEFTDYKWAHLDIAGVADSAEAKGSTGRPFKLLLDVIRNHAK